MTHLHGSIHKKGGDAEEVYQKMVSHVEGADKTSGGAYYHNSAGGFLDAGASLELEEAAMRFHQTEVLRAATESGQLALLRAAQERHLPWADNP